MKIIAASVSAVLLGSIPGALSAEPSLRGGAALVTDFEDQAADLVEKVSEDYDLDFKKEKPDDKKARREAKLKKAQKKFKKTKKRCVDLTTSECITNSKCTVKESRKKSSPTCIPKMRKPKFFEDEEDFYVDSSEDLFDFEEDYDWDEDSEDLFDSEDYDLDFEVEEGSDKEEAKRLKALKKYEKAMKKYKKEQKDYKKADKEYKRARKHCSTLTTRSLCGAVDNSCVVKESSSRSTFKCNTTVSKPKAPKEPKKPKFFEDEEDFYLDSSEDLFDFEEDYDWDEDSEVFDSEDYDLDFEVDDKALEKYAKDMEKFKKAEKKYNKAMKEYKQEDKAYKQAKKRCATFITRSVCGALNNNCVVKESSSGSTFKCNTTVSKPKPPKAPKEPKKPKFFEDGEDFYFDSSEDLFDFEEDYDWEV